jgi:hypothetical protein
MRRSYVSGDECSQAAAFDFADNVFFSWSFNLHFSSHRVRGWFDHRSDSIGVSRGGQAPVDQALTAVPDGLFFGAWTPLQDALGLRGVDAESRPSSCTIVRASASTSARIRTNQSGSSAVGSCDSYCGKDLASARDRSFVEYTRPPTMNLCPAAAGSIIARLCSKCHQLW